MKLSDRELLTHAGKVSAENAKAKAELEYDCYQKQIDELPRPVDAHFEQAVKLLAKRAKR